MNPKSVSAWYLFRNRYSVANMDCRDYMHRMTAIEIINQRYDELLKVHTLFELASIPLLTMFSNLHSLNSTPLPLDSDCLKGLRNFLGKTEIVEKLFAFYNDDPILKDLNSLLNDGHPTNTSMSFKEQLWEHFSNDKSNTMLILRPLSLFNLERQWESIYLSKNKNEMVIFDLKYSIAFHIGEKNRINIIRNYGNSIWKLNSSETKFEKINTDSSFAVEDGDVLIIAPYLQKNMSSFKPFTIEPSDPDHVQKVNGYYTLFGGNDKNAYFVIVERR